ncbi:hypothetical protein B566_EDAN012226 [Ephemera danica]|nr:hypothetical protein B566_EDAN012226 [Ephemera danica]
MKRYAKPRAFVDKLHKGFVWTCVGLTAYGLFLLGLRVERYFTVIRPQREIREAELKKQLLAEGRDKALLNDSAPELKL